MKKFSYKLIMALIMALIFIPLCAFMYGYGFTALLITAFSGALLILCAVFSFNIYTGMLFADYKLLRFTKKLKKQLKQASCIYIMGHAFSDLD